MPKATVGEEVEEDKDQHITLSDEEFYDLVCNMTTPQIMKKVDEQIEVLDEIDLHDAEFAKAKERHNGKIKGLKVQLGELREVLKSKKETKEIPCQWEYNWTTNYKKLIRLDSRETVKELEISEIERQQNLEGVPPGKTPDETPEDTEEPE